MKGYVGKKRYGRTQKTQIRITAHSLSTPPTPLHLLQVWLKKNSPLNCKYNLTLCFTLWHFTVCALWLVPMRRHPENMQNSLLQFSAILMKLMVYAGLCQLSILCISEHTSGIARVWSGQAGTKYQIPDFSIYNYREMKNSKTFKVVPLPTVWI